MSAYTALERLAEPIGRDIGRANSKVQADLLNGLFTGVSTTGPPGAHADEMQAAYITDDLTPRARSWIILLARFCEGTGAGTRTARTLRSGSGAAPVPGALKP